MGNLLCRNPRHIQYLHVWLNELYGKYLDDDLCCSLPNFYILHPSSRKIGFVILDSLATIFSCPSFLLIKGQLSCW